MTEQLSMHAHWGQLQDSVENKVGSGVQRSLMQVIEMNKHVVWQRKGDSEGKACVLSAGPMGH